ncbi:hypothetical protein BZG35_03525 [Brevundimonas sp. LM2]|nr:hypothetical protein BZG35_03525 [Brevundimonas sp. LM2]
MAEGSGLALIGATSLVGGFQMGLQCVRALTLFWTQALAHAADLRGRQMTLTGADGGEDPNHALDRSLGIGLICGAGGRGLDGSL